MSPLLYFSLLLMWIVLVSILTVMVLVTVFFILSLLYIFIKFRSGPGAPFVPLPRDPLAQLVNAMDINENSIVYDLGSGDGRVVRALWEAKGAGSYIGIERNFIVHYCTVLYSNYFYHHRKVAKIKFILDDIFNHDLGNATHITMYLFPGVLKMLQPKLEQELQQGTLVYSVDFQFPDKKPKEIISLKRKEGLLGRHVYVYEF